MTERVAEDAGTLPIELILRCHVQRGPRGDRARNQRVGVVHVQVQRHGAAAERLGRADVELGELVRDHQDRAVVKVQLDVPDAAAGLGQSKDFLHLEHVAIEVDGGGGVVDAEVRKQLVDGHGGTCLSFLNRMLKRGPWRRFCAAPALAS
ncbi:hypothetical protein D9M69_612970 [compost metagenome]